MLFAASSPWRSGRPLPSRPPGGPAGRRRRPPRWSSRRTGRRGVRTLATGITAAATLALSGLLAIVPAGVARAGGESWADCPSGQLTTVEALVPGEPGGATYLEQGFYARVGASWPPSTAVFCRTEAGRGDALGEPKLKVMHLGCAGGTVDFGVRDPDHSLGSGFGGPPVTWGTFVPAGWYTLEDPGSEGWTTVCWSPWQR